MLKSKGFIFTNKKHTEKGIMSAILGVLANITMGTAKNLDQCSQP